MAQDIILNNNDDLTFLNGDLNIDFSDNQHIGHILKANKGNFYQFPEIGVGMIKYINSEFTKAGIKNDIKENLELDDMVVTDIKVIGTGDDLTIIPDAKRLE